VKGRVILYKSIYYLLIFTCSVLRVKVLLAARLALAAFLHGDAGEAGILEKNKKDRSE